MELTDAELRRARTLQRRLKIVRFFSRRFAPITNKIQSWRDELQLLYNKKFLEHAYQQFAQQHIGDPVDLLRRRLPDDQELNALSKLFSIFKNAW